MYLTGLLVVKKWVKVNYTRKINHFALLIVPFLMGMIVQTNNSLGTSLADYFMQFVWLLSGLLFFVLFIKPVREKVSVCNTAFLSIDRPEDRPYTLKWMVTQTAANFIAAIPISFYLGMINKPELIFILILINGIWDGLAEPIGIKFWKHKYKTFALFTNKKYERSIEGSLTVFIVSLMVILLFASSFSTLQLIITLLTLPIIMTITEAKAPHTWDNPLLFAVWSIVLFLVFHFIP